MFAKFNNWLASNVEEVLMALTAVAAIAIPISQHLGILNFLMNPEKYSEFAIYLLASIAICLFLSRKIQKRTFDQAIRKIDNLEAAVKRETKAIEGALTGSILCHPFESSEQIYKYAADRIKNAKHTVDDTSWHHKADPADRATLSAIKEYEEAIHEASKRIKYREIFVFCDPGRLRRFRNRITENSSGYSCGYFQEIDNSPIPRFEFLIIDEQEVIFYHNYLDGERCSIIHSELAKVFRSYYDEMWDRSIKLKEGKSMGVGDPHKVHVDDVLKQYGA